MVKVRLRLIEVVGLNESANGGTFDAVVTKLNSSGGLVWSTYLGSTANTDLAQDLALDSNDNVIVVGSTDSPNFPIVNGFQTQLSGSQDGYIANITADGSTLAYSSYLGYIGDEEIWDVLIDAKNQIIVTGWTSNADHFPGRGVAAVTSGPVGTIYADGFISFISADPVPQTVTNTVTSTDTVTDTTTLTDTVTDTVTDPNPSTVTITEPNPSTVTVTADTTITKTAEGFGFAGY